MPNIEANIVPPPLFSLPCPIALTLLCCSIADKAKCEHRGEKNHRNGAEQQRLALLLKVRRQAESCLESFSCHSLCILHGLYDIDIEVRPHNTSYRWTLPGQRDSTQSQMPRSMRLEGGWDKKKRDECAYCRPCLCKPQGFRFKTNELLLLLVSTDSDARRQH